MRMGSARCDFGGGGGCAENVGEFVEELMKHAVIVGDYS